MNALEIARAVMTWERQHPEYAAAKQAWLQAEKEHRAFVDSLLPRFEVTTKPRYAPGAWGIANRDWRYR